MTDEQIDLTALARLAETEGGLSTAGSLSLIAELRAAREDADRLANALRAMYDVTDLPISEGDALHRHDAARSSP